MSNLIPSYLVLSALGLLGYNNAMANIKTDFIPYTDQWGLVHPSPPAINGPSGNGLLYTAEAIAALMAHNQLTPDMVDQYKQAYLKCETQPGLFNRNPMKSFGQNQQDDYLGIAYAARYLNMPEMAQRVLDYGDVGADSLASDASDKDKTVYKILSLFGLIKVKKTYHDLEPGKFNMNAWFARWPFLAITMKFAAGKDPNLLEKIIWSAVQLWSLRNDVNAHDNWILSWVAWKTVEGKSWITDLVGKYWLKKFVEKQKDMGDLLERYFNDKTQPIAIHLKGVY